MGPSTHTGMAAWVEGQGFSETVRILPPSSLRALKALYQGCSALFHPAAPSPWGGPLRLTLSNARPVVALETTWSDAIVGPAAYLVPPREDGRLDARALGAALVTVIVEESLGEELSEAAEQRAAAWNGEHFPQALGSAYLQVKSA